MVKADRDGIQGPGQYTERHERAHSAIENSGRIRLREAHHFVGLDGNEADSILEATRGPTSAKKRRHEDLERCECIPWLRRG